MTLAAAFLKESFAKLVEPGDSRILISRNRLPITMIFKFLALAVAFAAALISSPLAHAQQPNAQQILEGARLAAGLNVLDEGLSGNLRKGRTNVPVTLFLKGKDIQFQFTEPAGPLRIFHMRIGDAAFNLFEIIDGKTVAFPPAKIVEPIAGTDLTYEDLAMRFLYWPNAVLEGTENVGGQACYKILVRKPAGVPGRYETVHVWVHTKFGAFMRIRGYDRNGGVLKEFQVQDVMKVANDVWTLRKMQVATIDPATGRRASLTDVTFDSPRKVAPRGIRR
jgi:hypothetical protein